MGFFSKRTKKSSNGDRMKYDESELLKASVSHLKNELDKFRDSPLLICEFKGVFNGKAIIRMPNGAQFMVNYPESLHLRTGDNVLVEQRSLTIIDRLGGSKYFDVEGYIVIQKPDVSWDDVGGLNKQINEIREVVELPLNKPDLFKCVGIDPPKGILLYGAPGTGKTLLAKAVATSTNSTFISIIAPELIQKFIGEGAKMIKDIFKLAREKAPSIIFIDEIDAISAERQGVGVSGEREVQRTFMQLLSEIDGFNSFGGVKVIAATNRMDIIDPALLRPGRFDRLIEIPLPDEKGREQILKIYTKRMKLDNVNFNEILNKTIDFSGADIRAICTEAGYFAIRDGRSKVKNADFLRSIEKIGCFEEGPIGMFG